MTLSVLTITYNHEAFIAKAIESFLMQKVNFDFEIVIGEDFSTDSTLQICLEYEKKHPGKIRVLQRQKNYGVMPNLIDTLSHCQGKYIAFCEGDDYWTDPNKLQKQVDFLEKNPEYSICYHNVTCIAGKKKYRNTQWDTPEDTNLTYLLRKGNYLTTLSVVFRNHPGIIPFLEKFRDSPFGDYLMHISNALTGKIRFMKDNMAIYRVHSGGIWSKLGPEKGIIKTLQFLEMIYDRMDDQYRDDLRIQLLGWLESIVRSEGLAKLTNDPELQRIVKKMEVPLFMIDYIKFNVEEKSRRSYYSKYVPMPILVSALKEKLSNKIFKK